MPRVVIGASGATPAADGRSGYAPEFAAYSFASEGAVERGFIQCTATPIPGGCRLKVSSAHARNDDALTLALLAEVLDKKTKQLRSITLATLAQDAVPETPSFRREMLFDLHYADVEKYLQRFNPALRLTPGVTQLAVSAAFLGSHTAGGFSRGGAFRLPRPQGGRETVLSVRAAAAGRSEATGDLPLDMQVAYPEELTRAVPQLKPDGSIKTRIESELKGASSADELHAAVLEAYRLSSLQAAGDQASVEKTLGKGWSIQPVRRYWLEDDGTEAQPGHAGAGLFAGFRVDDEGLPLQDPLVDRYLDTDDLAMTREGGAIRLRSNRQATCLNVKPGRGRRDATSGIVQRVEVGLDLRSDTTWEGATSALQALSRGLWGPSIFNHAQAQVRQLDAAIDLTRGIAPWLQVTQDRHKFSIKHTTGVEVELSLDDVRFETLKPIHHLDGAPRRGSFSVVEAELDHLQLQSANEVGYEARGAESGNFRDMAAQEKWLEGTSSEVTMDVDPRLHELGDLEDAAFRATADYRAFQTLSKRLMPILFPNGLGPVAQKAAHAAELIGLSSPDARGVVKNIASFAKDSPFRWTPELERAVSIAAEDPAKRRGMEGLVAASGSAAIGKIALQYLGGPELLQYDLPALERRVASRLKELGFASTPAIAAMFSAATTANLPPADLEAELQWMRYAEDAHVFDSFARKLGVAQVPEPAPDVAALFSPWHMERYRARLDQNGLEASFLEPLREYCERVAEKVGVIRKLRDVLDDLNAQVEWRLSEIHAMAQLEPPVARMKESYAMQRAETQLEAQLVRFDEPLRDLVRGIVRFRTAKGVADWTGELDYRPILALRTAANCVGVTMPKLRFDLKKFDEAMALPLARAGVAPEPRLQDFLRNLLEEEVPLATLTSVAGKLSAMDLPSALKDMGVHVVGMKIPEISYDEALVLEEAQRLISNMAQFYPVPGALKSFVREGLRVGLRPSQLTGHLRALHESGTAGALRQAAASGYTAPPFSLDPGRMADGLKKMHGTSWTAAHEAYARLALPKALACPTFFPRNLQQDGGPAATLAYLERSSGMKAPASP